MKPIHRSAVKPFAGPGARRGYGRKGRLITVHATRQSSRIGYYRSVHRHGRASLIRKPEAEPEEVGLAAAAAAVVVASQLPFSYCRGSPV